MDNQPKKPINNQKPNGGKSPDPKQPKTIMSMIMMALVFTVFFNVIFDFVSSSNLEDVSYTEFLEMVDDGRIHTAQFQRDRILILTNDEAEKEGKEQKIYFTGLIPNQDLNKLTQTLYEKGVDFEGEIIEELNPIVSLIFSWVLPLGIMYLLFSLLTRSMSKKMGGGFGGMGKSNAKVYVEKETGVTFKDVAGQDEAKESLEEIIDFLHHPTKYTDIGAKLPKGALLVGSPGTGKTLIAKAVAGEANVPFFSISGSDFVEMFVGLGASRVRDLFTEASKMAPAIIFIDEIDAIGKSRDSKYGGGNDEREQTLNQLLAEIDGFDSSKGVVILAATNRPEILDKALLRAGRFDRRIVVDHPNLSGRYQTLRVHTKNIKLNEDVDLNKIAMATAGAVGADLANLVNEAALRAVRLGRHAVNQEDLLVSFEVVIAGTEKKGTVLTHTEKRIISYHEVGHALVAATQKNAQSVSKITIVPHTSGALGYTLQLPEEEKFLHTKEDLLTEIYTLLGGRAAEELVFGAQTSGASNDIERATNLARKMVTQYGMSEKFGLMALSTISNQYLDGSSMMNCADTTASEADTEIRKLLAVCYDKSVEILQNNRGLLDEISLHLLEKETITGEELMSFINAEKKQDVDLSDVDIKKSTVYTASEETVLQDVGVLEQDKRVLEDDAEDTITLPKKEEQ